MAQSSCYCSFHHKYLAWTDINITNLYFLQYSRKFLYEKRRMELYFQRCKRDHLQKLLELIMGHGKQNFNSCIILIYVKSFIYDFRIMHCGLSLTVKDILLCNKSNIFISDIFLSVSPWVNNIIGEIKTVAIKNNGLTPCELSWRTDLVLHACRKTTSDAG